MSELSVLVIEDDAVLNGVIQAALERAGYRTHASGTCADGLVLATRREMPGLLVLDVRLPDGTGWDLLEDLRHGRPDAAVPVIFISAGNVSRTQLRKHVVDRLFAKPFHMGLFVEAVKELLHRPVICMQSKKEDRRSMLAAFITAGRPRASNSENLDSVPPRTSSP